MLRFSRSIQNWYSPGASPVYSPASYIAMTATLTGIGPVAGRVQEAPRKEIRMMRKGMNFDVVMMRSLSIKLFGLFKMLGSRSYHNLKVYDHDEKIALDSPLTS